MRLMATILSMYESPHRATRRGLSKQPTRPNEITVQPLYQDQRRGKNKWSQLRDGLYMEDVLYILPCLYGIGLQGHHFRQPDVILLYCICLIK